MQHAPVSAGSVKTLIALISAVIICSGLVTRSQYLHTGLNASFVVVLTIFSGSEIPNTNNGILFTVAVAQAVTIFAAPGPTDDAQGMIFFLPFCFA